MPELEPQELPAPAARKGAAAARGRCCGGAQAAGGRQHREEVTIIAVGGCCPPADGHLDTKQKSHAGMQQPSCCKIPAQPIAQKTKEGGPGCVTLSA